MGDTVTVRREGNAVILEPVKDWPVGYVESFAAVPGDLPDPIRARQSSALS